MTNQKVVVFQFPNSSIAETVDAELADTIRSRMITGQPFQLFLAGRQYIINPAMVTFVTISDPRPF
jgi:hypothetical protein